MRGSLIICILILFSCNKNAESNQINPINSWNEPSIKKVFDLNCFYSELSNQFDLKIDYEKFDNNSAMVKILVFKKDSAKPEDSLFLSVDTFWEGVFENCKNVRSYPAQINSNDEIVDNYCGDIVIADFNFDGKDDIAIFQNHGNSSGPFYNFQIQGKDLKFTPDEFLNDSVRYFPFEINSKNNIITTFDHAGVCGLSENNYQLEKSGKWKLLNRNIMNICDE